jgi:hypothetical protein
MSRIITSLAEIIADQTQTYLPPSKIGVILIVADSQIAQLEISKFESQRFRMQDKHVCILHSRVGRSKQTVSEYLLRRLNTKRGIEIQMMTNIVESWDGIASGIRVLEAGEFGVAPINSGEMNALELLRTSYDRVTQDERISFVEGCVQDSNLYSDATIGHFTLASIAIRALLDAPDLSRLRNAPEWDLFVRLAKRFE